MLVTREIITEYTRSAVDEARQAQSQAKENRSSSWSNWGSGGRWGAPLIHYTDNSWTWGARNVTTNYGNNGQSSQKEQGISYVTVLFGLLFGVGGAVFTGRLYKQMTKLSDAFYVRESVRRALSTHEWSDNVSQSVRSDFERLVSVQSEIDRLQYRKVSNYFYSALGLAIGGALLGFGALSMAPWMMAAGRITLFAAGLLAAVTIGLHWDDDSELSQLYRHVEVLGDRVNAVLDPWIHPSAWSSPPVLETKKEAAQKKLPKVDEPSIDFSKKRLVRAAIVAACWAIAANVDWKAVYHNVEKFKDRVEAVLSSRMIVSSPPV